MAWDRLTEGAMHEPKKWVNDWRADPHAYECYTCEHGSEPPAACPACKGCINRDSRPHWVPKASYAEAARAAISSAAGGVGPSGGGRA